MNDETPLQRALRETGGPEYEKILKRRQREPRPRLIAAILAAALILIGIAAVSLMKAREKPDPARQGFQRRAVEFELASRTQAADHQHVAIFAA